MKLCDEQSKEPVFSSLQSASALSEVRETHSLEKDIKEQKF